MHAEDTGQYRGDQQPPGTGYAPPSPVAGPHLDHAHTTSVLMPTVQTPAAMTTASVAKPASRPNSRPQASNSARRAFTATVINWMTT